MKYPQNAFSTMGPAAGVSARQLHTSLGLGLFLFKRGEGNKQSLFSTGILRPVTGSSVHGSGLNHKLQTRGQSVLMPRGSAIPSGTKRRLS